MSFYKKSREEKIKFINEHLGEELHFKIPNDFIEKMSENVLENFNLPFSVAPGLILNDKEYIVPMVTEESSVVAACSKSFKWWSQFGGFKSSMCNDLKLGTIYAKEKVERENVELCINAETLVNIDKNMKNRKAGLHSFDIQKVDEFYKIMCYFKTADSMGANYINTFLEALAQELKINALMCILSNNYQDSVVKVEAQCPVSEMKLNGLECFDLAHKIVDAYKIAKIDKDRAVTHNKGIFNGIDSVLIATGNDFRAVEASGHAFNESYSSLSRAFIKDENFHLEMTIGLSLGIVGGATKINPQCQKAMKILKINNANELSQIVASVGLAQNFMAVASLVTTGIQKGHMKMHLDNLLDQYNLNKKQIKTIKDYFKDKKVTKVDLENLIKKKFS